MREEQECGPYSANKDKHFSNSRRNSWRSSSQTCHLCDKDLLGKKLNSSLARALSRRYDFSVQLYYRHLMDRVVCEWDDSTVLLSALFPNHLNRITLNQMSAADSHKSLRNFQKTYQPPKPVLLIKTQVIALWHKAHWRRAQVQSKKVAVQPPGPTK